MKCFDLVQKTRPDVNLVIGGKCSVFMQKGLKVYQNITDHFIEELFNKALIFLMPGAIGGLQSVLQAMSRKCVCIIGDKNLLLTHLIKDNETGFVIPTNNPKILAKKIIDLLNDKSLLKKIASEACYYVNKYFTWDKVIQKMSQHFNR